LGQPAILARLLRFDEEQELWRPQNRGQGDLDRAFVTLTPVVGQSKDLEDSFDFLRQHGPSECPLNEPGDHLAGTIEARRVTVSGSAEQDSLVWLGKLLRLDGHGSAYDHRVDVQSPLGPVTLVPAHVGGDPRGLDDIASPGLAGSKRDRNDLVL